MSSLLPIETFRAIFGFNPFHFWQLANSKVPVMSACNTLIFQHNWQFANQVGRDEIERAIEAAEQRLRDYLGYGPAPRYTTETVAWPRFNDISLVRHRSAGADGRWLSVQLSEGYIQAVGVETLTSIGTANVTYSDEDGDGLDDTFVVTIATTVTDPTQIAAYFIPADRLDNDTVSEEWRIQPVKVTISGGIATIRGRAWLLVKPVRYEGVAVNKSGLDPDDAANFVTQLVIYQRTTNPNGDTVDTAQATLIWETTPCSGWWCCYSCCGDATYSPSDSRLDPAAQAMAVARVGIRDSKLGIVLPGEALRNVDTGIWYQTRFDTCYEPDRVTVRTLAGVPLVNQEMSKEWQLIVARLAAAELTHPICACREGEAGNRELSRWQFDLGRTAGANDEAYGAVTAEDLSNPFGTRRGHVYAWRQVKNLRNLQGFLP